jgi:AcrR family transcriptional regulator
MPPKEQKTVDLRVRRTRQLLRQALMELMPEKGFQAITVQDLSDRAMINRATFYEHFADKYALLEYSLRDLFSSRRYLIVSQRNLAPRICGFCF